MKILLVSYAFPPVSSPGAIRIERFAHYLAASGHAVTVLTCSNAYSSMKSRGADSNGPTAPQIDYKVVKTRDLVDKTSYSGTNHSARQRTVKGRFLALLASLFYPDRNVTWVPTALFAARALEGEFDIVLGTYPSTSNFIVAAYAAKRAKARLVLDYRDLWTDSDAGRMKSWIRRWCDRLLEDWLHRSSALILTVNQFDAAIMRSRVPESTSVHTVYNGYELDEPCKSFAKPLNFEPHTLPKKYSIAYAGSFYGGERDPSGLFGAVEALYKKGILTRENFTIGIYGNRESEVEHCAAAHGITELVAFHEMLDRPHLFHELSHASLLLAITRKGAASAGELTTKVFEYIGLGGEILCLTKPGFEVVRVLGGVEGATCIDVDDVAAISEFLMADFHRWNSRGRTSRQYIRQGIYTRQASTRELECALQGLL